MGGDVSFNSTREDMIPVAGETIEINVTFSSFGSLFYFFSIASTNQLQNDAAFNIVSSYPEFVLSNMQCSQEFVKK